MRTLYLLAYILVPLAAVHGQNSYKSIPDSLMQGELTDETYRVLSRELGFAKSYQRFAAGKRLLNHAERNNYPPQEIAFCYRVMAQGKLHTEADSFLHFNALATSHYEDSIANRSLWPILTYERAEYFNSIENYDSMLYYIDRTLGYEVIKEHIIISSAALQLKSGYFESLGRFDSAQIVLIESLNIIADNKPDDFTYNRVRGAIYAKLGRLYRKYGNFQEHRQNIRRSLRMLKDSTSKVLILGNLADSYRQSTQYDSAYIYALQAKQFVNDIESYNLAYKRLTETLTDLGRYQEAARMKDSLDKYNALASRYVRKKMVAKDEGALLIGLGKIQEGKAAFRAAFPLDSTYVTHWNPKIYIDYVKAMAPHQSSKTIVRQLDTLKRLFYYDSRDTTASIIEDIRIRYQTEKIESENNLLTLRSQAAETAATNRQRQLWLVLALLAAVGGGLIFATRESRRRKQLNEALSQRNNRITLLNKDINHRTSGYLFNIIKLLKEQRFKLEDAGADPSVLDELERQTLVYTKLQSLLTTVDDRTVVNLNDYLQELTALLHTSFEGSGMPILITLKTADVNIDPKLAAPLALVLNELMTNTAKYAIRRSGVAAARFEAALIEENTLLLHYEDDGPDTNRDTSEHFSSNTGLDLIEGLTHQMEAERLPAEGFGYRARVEL